MAQLQKLTSDNADLDSTLSLVQGQLSSAKTQLQVGREWRDEGDVAGSGRWGAGIEWGQGC